MISLTKTERIVVTATAVFVGVAVSNDNALMMIFVSVVTGLMLGNLILYIKNDGGRRW